MPRAAPISGSPEIGNYWIRKSAIADLRCAARTIAAERRKPAITRYVISPKGNSASNSCNYLRCINSAESRCRYPFNQRGIWLRAATKEIENAPAP